MSAPTTSEAEVVETFLAALARLDVDAVGELLDPDVVYQNVSLPPARGRAATLRVLGSMARPLTSFDSAQRTFLLSLPIATFSLPVFPILLLLGRHFQLSELPSTGPLSLLNTLAYIAVKFCSFRSSRINDKLIKRSS